MTRNQKIAIGCGGVGCLGLLVILLASVLLYWLRTTKPSYSNYNSNYNSNSNSNSNRNLNSNNSYPSVTMSDDDKHRLFQAAGMTKDSDLILRVLKKIGMMSQSGTPSPDYQQFIEDHRDWGAKNSTFIRSVLTPAKARAYVDAHLDD